MTASSEFSDTFGRFLRDFESALRDLQTPPRIENARFGSNLTSDDFKRMLASSSANGPVLSNLPRSIDIGEGVASRMEILLNATTQDGRERSRVGFINPSSIKVMMGPTWIGNATTVLISTELPEQAPGGFIPAFAMHVHPVHPQSVQSLGAQNAARAVEHLSVEDLATFLSWPITSKMVISAGNNLMAVKTTRTPPPMDREVAIAQLSELFRRTQKSFEPADVARVFTKVACVQYSLGLYLSRPTARGNFHEVALPALR